MTELERLEELLEGASLPYEHVTEIVSGGGVRDFVIDANGQRVSGHMDAEDCALLVATVSALPKLIEIAKQAESVCRKLEHPTASVTYLDQEALRAALSSLKEKG